MGKTFRPYEPDQLLLMPVALQEWLPEDHLAYFIGDVVDHLDLASITGRYVEERGYPPYHPCMMVKVLVYAYCVGVPSSRRMEKRLHEDIAFRVLAANNTPASEPSPTFARIIWRRWAVSLYRCLSCARGRGW